MSTLDKIIGYFSPEAAVRRAYARYQLELVKNSGYGNYGASRRKKALKDWDDAGGSAAEDIHENLSTLRVRARDLYMGVPTATGALKTYRTNVVGSGLTPKPVIDGEALGLTEDQADTLEKQISREFALWADSTSCDAERLSTFYELQQLAFLNWLMSGDVFAVLQNKDRPGTVYSTCVLLIEADRVCTPGDYLGAELSQDEKIIGGVEVNETGEVVAYHICKHHPLSWRNASAPGDWTRVEAYGRDSGRRNILHIMTRERIGARRGVPLLAPVIEALKQLGRYTDAELMAAVVNGFMAVFIETDEPKDDDPVGEVDPGEVLGGEAPEELKQTAPKDEIKMGSGIVVDLAPGEKANAVQPGRPNANFDGFVNSVARQIGAALELPHELLMKQFTASYSASRAALLEAWKAFSEYRDWFVEKFCQPIYEEWLSEAVARGRISAPGYFNNPLLRKTYCNAQWYGPTQGQLDPVKEVTAAELRVRYGYSTRAKEAMELTGTDFWDNIRTGRRETELMAEAGLDFRGSNINTREEKEQT